MGFSAVIFSSTFEITKIAFILFIFIFLRGEIEFRCRGLKMSRVINLRPFSTAFFLSKPVLSELLVSQVSKTKSQMYSFGTLQGEVKKLLLLLAQLDILLYICTKLTVLKRTSSKLFIALSGTL